MRTQRQTLPHQRSPLHAALFLMGLFATSGQVSAQVARAYMFMQTTGTYTALTGATPSTAANADPNDGTEFNIPLGFTFNYNGAAHTEVGVGVNGWLRIGADATIGPNGAKGNGFGTPGNDNLVAPLWDDHHMYLSGGSIVHLTEGTAPDRVFTMQWDRMLWTGAGSTSVANRRCDFQVKLYEGSDIIEVRYGTMGISNTGRSASIGLQGTGADFISVTPAAGGATVSSTTSNDNINAYANINNGTVFRFLPGGPVYAVFNGTLYTEGFEDWTDMFDTLNVPSIHWSGRPFSGNSSWRRNDQGVSAGGWGNDNGAYSPVSIEGNHSARFHSTEAANGQPGTLDLHIDMSAALASCELRFDLINGSSTFNRDSLTVWLSTEGGSNFTRISGNLGVFDAWTEQVIPFTSNAPFTVLRFRGIRSSALSNNTDIGVDNLRIIALPVGIADIPGTASLRWMGQDGDGHWLRTGNAVVRGWEVLDAMGRVLLAGNSPARNERLRIDLAGQGSGTYLVRVMTDRDPVTVRLVHMAP